MKKNLLNSGNCNGYAVCARHIIDNCLVASSRILFIVAVLALSLSSVYGQTCSVNANVTFTICADEALNLQGNIQGAPPSGGFVSVWSQVGGPSLFINTPNVIETSVTGYRGITTATNYTFRLTTTCGDGALIYDDVVVTVLPISAANAGPDMTYCPGTYYLAANNPAGPNESGLWQGGGNGISIVNSNAYNSAITLLGNASGSATLTWTITNSETDCSTSDQVVITNRGGITPVDAGTDQTLTHCYSTTQSTNLNGSFGGTNIDGQQGTWTIITGPNVPTIANPHSNTTSVSNLIEGTYRFRWTVQGPCTPSGADEVEITVPAPTADLTGVGIQGGSQQIFCDGRTSTFLTGTIPQYINETVQWVQTGGSNTVSIANPTNPVTEVTGLNPTAGNVYNFTYTINNNVTNCSGSAGVSVKFIDAPTMNITPGFVFLNCDESVASIPYTATNGLGITEYRILSGPPTLISNDPPVYRTFPTNWSSTASSPAIITGLTGLGVYVVQMRRSAPEGVSCSSAFDQVSVITSFGNALANAGTPQILPCNQYATTIAGNEPAFGQGTWSLISGPGTATTLGDIHDPSLYIENLVPGLYTFRWLISGGPMCDPNFDDVTVLVASEEPTTSAAGSDQTICSGATITMDAAEPSYNFEQGTWSVVGPNPTPTPILFDDIHSGTSTVSGFVEEGSPYTLRWTIANGCGTASDDVVITVDNTMAPTLADA